VSGSRLVYSTDGGAVLGLRPDRPPAGRSKGGTGPAIPQAPDDGWVRVWRVKGGRGGKTATVVTGLPGSADDLEAIAVALRRAVGAGGGVRQGAVEIQGDHRERLRQRLVELGYRVKLAGG